VFVVIFPILFGFAIAFTNYNLYHTPPAKLVDWVGLKNFVNIFTLSIWRSTFWMCCSGRWCGRCWRPPCNVPWACCWRFW
jgi:ABC-type sugar transport system permease subunit